MLLVFLLEFFVRAIEIFGAGSVSMSGCSFTNVCIVFSGHSHKKTVEFHDDLRIMFERNIVIYGHEHLNRTNLVPSTFGDILSDTQSVNK